MATPAPEFAALVERFIAHLSARGRSASTVETRRHCLVVAVETWTRRGVLRPADLGEDDLLAVIAERRAAGLSASTLTATAVSMVLFTAWLHRQGLLLSDPGEGLTARQEGDRPLPPAPLSQAQVAALLAAQPGRTTVHLRQRTMLELIYGCALRLGEALGLRVDDLDLGAGTVFVCGKGGHERVLPVLPPAAAALADYLAVRGDLVRGPDAGVLFITPPGTGIAPTSVRDWLHGLARRALGEGVRVHPHALRHAAAVHLLQRGTDIRHIQAFLGHASLDVTTIYLRLVPGQLRDDYDAAMPPLAGFP